MSYCDFARFYDRLTENIDYEALAVFYRDIFGKYGNGKELLDLACGSGGLSIPLKRLGFNVTGADLSSEMLTEAAKKSSEIRWLCADMTDLRLENRFDCIVCGLDSINHLENKEQIQAAFDGAYAALKQGGVFAADMNTPYKHKEILGNNAYTFDLEGLFCSWQNEPDESDPLCRVDMYLDFFSENNDGSYTRYTDFLSEIALPVEEVEEMLVKSGFKICEICEYETGKPLTLTDNVEKFTFAAMKPYINIDPISSIVL